MRLSIGEMSKLHDITIQTLRYYDKIDLLKPSEVDPRTNYRYYYQEDCDRLARINIFKSLGLPLEDIKRMLTGNLTDTERVLLCAQDMVKNKIKQLNSILKYLEDQEIDIQAFNTQEDYTKPCIKKFDERYGYLIPVDEQTNLENRIKAIHSLERQHHMQSEILFRPSRIIGIKADGTLYLKSLVAIQREQYKGQQGNYTLDKGFYGVINHIGNREGIKTSYECLRHYIQQKGMKAKNEAIEIITISSDLSVHVDEQALQIQIPLI